MKFSVLILGCNSAFPAHGRYPSAQFLQHFDDHYLIDCGEGTQMQMAKYRVKRMKINHIFISHLHGDHVYGLPGLITSFSQLHRERPLHLYGPVGLKEFVETVIRLSESRVEFDLIYHELRGNQLRTIYENDLLEIRAFPLRHRIETFGYRFQEKPRPLNVDKSAISKYQLTTEQILDLKSGMNIEIDGQERTFEEFTLKPAPLRSYVYCSDTVYDISIVPHINHCSVLYHETTFMSDLEELAELSKHSTTIQAANIASEASVGKLIIGHYSSRYRDLQPLFEEAKSRFENTELGIEGKEYEIERMG